MKSTKLIALYSFLTLALSTMLYGMDDEQKMEVYNETKYVSNIDPHEYSHIEFTPQGTFITLGNSKNPPSLPKFEDPCFTPEEQQSTKTYYETIQKSNQCSMSKSKQVLQHLQFYLLENLLHDSRFEHTNERCREYTHFLGYKNAPDSNTLNYIAQQSKIFQLFQKK